MLRWLSFFGAIAVVVAGAVFYLYKGPPDAYLIKAPEVGVKRNAPAAHEEKVAEAQQQAEHPAAPPVAAGPWNRVVAVTPRVVIPDARLTAVRTIQVPSMRDGKLLFVGTEIKLKNGEPLPPDVIKREIVYLVTEVQADETLPPEKQILLDGKRYRPLMPLEDVQPKKVRTRREERYFLPIDEGTAIKDGQLLALLDPSLAIDELNSKLAKMEAAEAERVASEYIREYYRAKYDMLVNLKTAATKDEVNEARAGWERYKQEVVSKGEEVKVAARELRQTETILELHAIRSTMNGQVKQLVRKGGEAVHNLEPVLEMVDLSKLRIRAKVDLQDLHSLPDPRDPSDKRQVNVEATSFVAPQDVLTGHMGDVTGVAVSKDGQIVSVSEDRSARIWEKSLKQCRERLVLWQPAAIKAVACTGPKAERNLCLTGSADGSAWLYDLDAKDDRAPQIGQLTDGHTKAINSVAFSPDGRWAVTGGEDRVICLWDIANAKLLQKFPAEWGHKSGVTSVTFLADPHDAGKLNVVSAGRDFALLVWPLGADGKPGQPTRLERRGGEVTTLGVGGSDPNGNPLLLFDQRNELRVMSLNGALWGSLSATGGSSFSRLALFSPDGTLILAAGGGGRLGLWRAPTDKMRGHEVQHLVWTSSRDEQAVTHCGAFSPDGKFLVTGTAKGNVIVWPMPDKDAFKEPLVAKVFNVDPEVNVGQVRLTLEMDNPKNRLLPGDVVTLVVYPE
jgi:WD40 repeat protein